MKSLVAFVILLFTAAALSQTVTTYLNAVAPGSCPAPTVTANAVSTCPTTDPASPLYVTPVGSSTFQPATSAATTSVTSFNGRTGAVKSPIGGATLQCTSITGTITIGANGAVTITNAVGTGCNL